MLCWRVCVFVCVCLRLCVCVHRFHGLRHRVVVSVKRAKSRRVLAATAGGVQRQRHTAASTLPPLLLTLRWWSALTTPPPPGSCVPREPQANSASCLSKRHRWFHIGLIRSAASARHSTRAPQCTRFFFWLPLPPLNPATPPSTSSRTTPRTQDADPRLCADTHTHTHVCSCGRGCSRHAFIYSRLRACIFLSPLLPFTSPLAHCFFRRPWSVSPLLSHALHPRPPLLRV